MNVFDSAFAIVDQTFFLFLAKIINIVVSMSKLLACLILQILFHMINPNLSNSAVLLGYYWERTHKRLLKLLIESIFSIIYKILLCLEIQIIDNFDHKLIINFGWCLYITIWLKRMAYDIKMRHFITFSSFRTFRPYRFQCQNFKNYHCWVLCSSSYQIHNIRSGIFYTIYFLGWLFLFWKFCFL